MHATATCVNALTGSVTSLLCWLYSRWYCFFVSPSQDLISGIRVQIVLPVLLFISMLLIRNSMAYRVDIHPFRIRRTTFFPFSLLLFSIPGCIPKESHLSASGPRNPVTLFLHSAFWIFCSVLLDPACCICLFHSEDKMAVLSLFTVTLKVSKWGLFS